jgi:acyl-CoA oxidase
LLDGPLKSYRFKASFDWRKMRLIMDSIDAWELRMKLWTFMENSPIFARTFETPSLDEQRRLASKRVFTLAKEKIIDIAMYFEKPELGPKYSTAIGSYDPSIQVKYGIGFGMFPSVVLNLGTERVQDLVYQNQNMENFGCFALTEFGHGSNTQAMKTTATYEQSTKSFVLNTPNFEAAKTWVGNLGKTATHAVVYAQLITPDGKCHGLNAFVVPIRDPKTMLAYPGVVIGDLGEKISLNGVDNGFGNLKKN